MIQDSLHTAEIVNLITLVHIGLNENDDSIEDIGKKPDTTQ